MAILHGIWLNNENKNCLFLWGETWRNAQVDIKSINSAIDIPFHPLSMTGAELGEWLEKNNLGINNCIQNTKPGKNNVGSTKTRSIKNKTENTLPIKSQIIAVITNYIEKDQTLAPLHSASLDIDKTIDKTIDKNTRQYLQPWQIEGFCLKPQDAIKFLTALPLSSKDSKDALLGGDLRFWVQMARWSLDLIARCKFLPVIDNSDSDFVAKWQVLLDSATDTTRLEKFAAIMPLICRTFQTDREDKTEDKINYLKVDFPHSSQQLILDFLNNIVDAQIREMLGYQSPVDNRLMMSLPSAVQQWLQSLNSTSSVINGDVKGLERLESVIKSWTRPLQHQLTGKAAFRTCFQLKPPTTETTNWQLNYFLQAVDEPEFLIDATTIWNHPLETLVYQNRTIEQPQETFLRGLGLASRLYPIITPSLETESPEFCTLNPMQAYEFIKSVTWKLEDNGLGVILPPSLANREGWANRLGLKINAEPVKQQQGRLGLQSLLNFQWQLAIGGQTISKSEFDQLVALNSPLVEINGEWVELRNQDIKTAQNFFASRKEQMSLSLEDALRISTGDTQVIEKLPVVSFDAAGALQELVATLTNNQDIQPLPTPQNFCGQLRPYQERGAAWLAFLERWGLGACLADDMGLGKSVQFIVFLLHLQEQNALEHPTLLVCPTSVLGNWEREVKKFAPKLKVLQYHGDKRPKGKTFTATINKYDLVITSYSLVQRDIKLLQTMNWQMIVLDEAQNIKNADSKQSQAVRKLETTFRVALTGTPVENRLQELWSILDFLNPGYLGNKQFFQRRFAMPIEKYGDADSLAQLRSLVQPFILRRLKTDKSIIQDLPDKQEMNVFCGLTAEQGQLYQQLVDESLVAIESADGLQRRGLILGLLVKLKQICNHPAQFLKESSLGKYNSGKLQRLEEMLEEVLAEENRALIFTQFAEWGKLLKPHLEKRLGREVLFLYGSTTKNQREEMIDRFQNDPQAPPIMILSLKAGGVGLNLTRANNVFHFDRWWNPAVENQATDRVFRIGQTKNVQVHKFVCTGTLEEKINDMIESKKQLAEQVVGAGEEWLTELNTDQLRDLLLLDRNAIIDDESED
ncbi:MAG: DEAD/DEAH box helicase [Nostocales cyanobacterium]|nr:MAG: DEAD/DEAH box helicase [Nostocales cyanobacterium]TAF12295.1 MAG: DEAD/DEAH box helicase [Nostocales cyanobacterium]